MEDDMEIIFQGRQDGAEASDSLRRVIQLLNERYHIETFREIHLSVTLVDHLGEDVELVDDETNEPYRVMEVCRKSNETAQRIGRPGLRLVIDNTR
jgi:hypothetical protein